MQSISLFGYGKTTRAIARVAKDVVFYDDNCKKTYIDEDGFRIKPSDDFDALSSKLEIPSPGIPPYHPLIIQAKNLMSEYDYFKDVSPFTIWISGTNGKTTTTQMMQHLLDDYGSLAGGNIGTPLAQLNQNAKIWILETSSFTMHYTNKATPDIYVLLPISPDHLSWHGSLDDYEKAKLKPLLSMRKEDTAIIPHKYKDIKTSAKVITYKDENDLAKIFNIDTKKVKFKGAFLVDALLSMAVKKILFKSIDYDGINSFEIDPHRQEELRDTKNRLWVNDTKATNIDATIAVLKRYSEKTIHLILGGDDKGVELEELFEFMQGMSLRIYTIGTNKHKLHDLAKRYNIKSTLCKNLSNAVFCIDKNLKDDEVAILSPAASSLDEFTSYAQRGDEFKRDIKNIS